MKKIIILALVALFAASCATHRVVTEQVPVIVTERHTDTLRLTRWRVDTCIMHDSIVVTEKGVDRWHTRLVTRRLTDTVYKARIDTVPKVVTVTKEVTEEVPTPLKWWQKALMVIGVIAIVGVALKVIR